MEGCSLHQSAAIVKQAKKTLLGIRRKTWTNVHRLREGERVYRCNPDQTLPDHCFAQNTKKRGGTASFSAPREKGPYLLSPAYTQRDRSLPVQSERPIVAQFQEQEEKSPRSKSDCKRPRGGEKESRQSAGKRRRITPKDPPFSGANPSAGKGTISTWVSKRKKNNPIPCPRFRWFVARKEGCWDRARGKALRLAGESESLSGTLRQQRARPEEKRKHKKPQGQNAQCNWG